MTQPNRKMVVKGGGWEGVRNALGRRIEEILWSFSPPIFHTSSSPFPQLYFQSSQRGVFFAGKMAVGWRRRAWVDAMQEVS